MTVIPFNFILATKICLLAPAH